MHQHRRGHFLSANLSPAWDRSSSRPQGFLRTTENNVQAPHALRGRVVGSFDGCDLSAHFVPPRITPRTLMLRYGHCWRYPDHRSGQYSMSSYLAARLKELEKEGALELTWGPAAGEWSYNSVISHWQRT